MTPVVSSGKSCAVNPLKLSPALGGALAFLGVERSLPLLHGSQGCTAFALVLMVRHFREAIPLQTTAMSELTTILGGAENVEEAVSNIYERARPRVIGICSTALTETRGEDVAADLRAARQRHPEWGDLDVVYASTPDYGGSLEQGWSRAVEAIVETLVPAAHGTRTLRQVNVLAGSHLTAADVEEIRDIVESFGLAAIVLPDLSNSLDGHVPDGHVPTSLGGTKVDEIAAMGRSVLTLALGEHMRPAAEALQRRTGVHYRLFDRLIGLDPCDAFVSTLLEVSGSEAPECLKRERSRLVDAMLDGHFSFDGQRVALAGEADLLLGLSSFFAGMGASIAAAIAPSASASLASVPAPRVTLGDLDDLEQQAGGCALIVANSHARDAAQRLAIPLYRVGFPVFDRLGAAQQVSVGYRGTRRLIVEVANILLDHTGEAHEVEPHGTPAAASHEPRKELDHAQAQAG